MRRRFESGLRSMERGACWRVMGFCGWVGVEFRKGNKVIVGGQSALRVVLHENDVSYMTENEFCKAMLLL